MGIDSDEEEVDKEDEDPEPGKGKRSQCGGVGDEGQVNPLNREFLDADFLDFGEIPQIAEHDKTGQNSSEEVGENDNLGRLEDALASSSKCRENHHTSKGNIILEKALIHCVVPCLNFKDLRYFREDEVLEAREAAGKAQNVHQQHQNEEVGGNHCELGHFRRRGNSPPNAEVNNRP